jgi:hypothetical protein
MSVAIHLSYGDKIRLGKGSRIVADRWYYDSTYLHDGEDRDISLFTRHFAIVETAAGNRHHRVVSNVERYDDDDKMVTAIRDRHMSEAPQEFNLDRLWWPPDLPLVTGA